MLQTLEEMNMSGRMEGHQYQMLSTSQIQYEFLVLYWILCPESHYGSWREQFWFDGKRSHPPEV